MGGRGGAGGKFGAATSRLPALSGSDKQVSWAESIRSAVFDNLSVMERAIEKRKSEVTYVSGDKARHKEAELLIGYTTKSVKTAREYYSTIFSTVTSASDIIDKRSYFSANQVNKAVYEEQSRGVLSKAIGMAKKQRKKR